MEHNYKEQPYLLLIISLAILICINLGSPIVKGNAATNHHYHNRITKTYHPKKLKKNHHHDNPSRLLNYRFITQKGKGNANDACEASALLMALHHLGLAKHYNLARFVRTIPRSKDPEKGYTKNPWKLGTGASLYPRAILKIAQRYGAKKSYIIDDYYKHGHGLYGRRASANSFKDAILKGYPVVFDGANRMQYGKLTNRRGYAGYRSNHVLMLYGYKDRRFYWTDPDHWYDEPGSTPINTFMHIINAPVRGPQAVAIGK